MKHLTPTQKAYIAGIVDGEGTISISVNKRNDHSRLGFSTTFRICNTDMKMLSYLQDITALGKITELHISATWIRKNIKTLYGWYVPANGLRELLPQIIPYLVTKKTQAEIMVYWLKNLTNPRGKHITQEIAKRKVVLANKMRRLNQRGVKKMTDIYLDKFEQVYKEKIDIEQELQHTSW